MSEPTPLRPPHALALVGVMLAVALFSGCALRSPVVSSSPSAASAAPSASASGTPSATERPAAPKGDFELPILGSVGFAAVPITLKKVTGTSGGSLKPGDHFTVTAVAGDEWVVKAAKASGQLDPAKTLINLPDLIPSITYRDSNAEESLFRSSGVALPGVTGKQLYQARGFNAKLQTEEYYLPVRPMVAKRIQTAQRAALAKGETLIIYEAFRPADVQRLVGTTLTKLYNSNDKVRAGISGGDWGISSFIALNLSNHQLGVAIDTSLGKVTAKEVRQGRDYRYTKMIAKELAMQSPMHELSRRSVSGRAGQLNQAMTPAAKRLRGYASAAGLRPISSEWWHFEDRQARASAPRQTLGRFRLKLPAS